MIERADQDDLPKLTKLITWMPDFTAGNLTLIITVLAGFYHFGGTISAITAEQANMKAAAATELLHSKEALFEVKQSVGTVDSKITSVQDKLGVMAVTIAEIHATQQLKGGTK